MQRQMLDRRLLISGSTARPWRIPRRLPSGRNILPGKCLVSLRAHGLCSRAEMRLLLRTQRPNDFQCNGSGQLTLQFQDVMRIAVVVASPEIPVPGIHQLRTDAYAVTGPQDCAFYDGGYMQLASNLGRDLRVSLYRIDELLEMTRKVPIRVRSVTSAFVIPSAK